MLLCTTTFEKLIMVIVTISTMALDTSYTYVDLFAGCGGMSLGFTNAGLRGIFAIEKDKWAFKTFSHNFLEKNLFNWPGWLPETVHSIQEFKKKKEFRDHLTGLQRTIDLVIGCPPCQGFSNRGPRQLDDERNNLYKDMLYIVSKLNPKIVILENVEGISRKFKDGETIVSQEIEKRLKRKFHTFPRVVDCSEFGIPQRRRRYFLWAFSKEWFVEKPSNPFELLEKKKTTLLAKMGIESLPVTAGDAIRDLQRTKETYEDPSFKHFKFGSYLEPGSPYQVLMRSKCNGKHPDSHRFVNHRAKTKVRFQRILENCEKGKAITLTDKERLGLPGRFMSVLSPDNPAMTVTSLPDDILHYEEPRILTVREIARLQSFPDHFEFKGQYTTGGENRSKECPRYTQVANAVPPILAELFGKTAIEYLDSVNTARGV